MTEAPGPTKLYGDTATGHGHGYPVASAARSGAATASLRGRDA